MRQAYNIAKTLTNLLGRLLFSPLGGVRGGLLLLLLAGPRYAYAQNDSENPYINSTHLYRVAMGNTGNTVTWELFDNLADVADFTLSGAGKPAWSTPAIVGLNAEIEIKFVSTEFTEGETWYLVYSEMNGDACVARRVAPDITIEANQFNLTVPLWASGCNTYIDTIWNNNDTIWHPRPMAVELRVHMDKASSHAVREWRFTGTVTVNGVFTIPAADVFIPLASRTNSSDFGTYTISDVNNAGGFTMVVNDLTGAGYDNADQVSFIVNINGPPTDDVQVTLTIANGQAKSGNNYTVVTDENSTGDNEESRLLFEIPNTSIVADSP